MTHRHIQAASQIELLPRDVREALVAVVVDANTYGIHGPDMTGMYALARDLEPYDIELWVPEPVAWEMAEHAASAWVKARASVRDARSALRKAGLKPAFDPVYTSRDEVISACMARFETAIGITLVPLTGQSAARGLRDQILTRPPGKTKGDVKTGASDSAWLRDVLDRVDGQGHKLLFLSQDRDITAAFTHWGHPPPLTCTREEIRGLLVPTEPATDEETVLIARHLFARMPEDLLNTSAGNGTALIGSEASWLRKSLELTGDYAFGDGLTEAYLTRLTALVGISRPAHLRPEPSGQGEPDQTSPAERRQTVTAYVHFLADAEVEHTVFDEAAGEPITHHYPVASDVAVGAPMVFEISNGTVVAARQDGEAYATPTPVVDDPDVAFAFLREAVSTVPGLAEVDKINWRARADEAEFATPAGPTVAVTRFEDERGDFGLKVRVGDRIATAVCRRAEEPVRRGPAEERDLYFLHTIVFQGPDGRTGNGAYALNAWIIAETIGCN